MTKNNETIAALVPYLLFKEMYQAWKYRQQEELIQRAKDSDENFMSHEEVLEGLGMKK